MNHLVFLITVGFALAHADVLTYFYDTKNNQHPPTSIAENDNPMLTKSQLKVHKAISKIVKSIVHDDNIPQSVPLTAPSEGLIDKEQPILQNPLLKVGPDVFQYGEQVAEVVPVSIRSDKLERVGGVSYEAEIHAEGHSIPNRVRFDKFKQEIPEQRFIFNNRQRVSATNKRYFVNQQTSNQQEFHNGRPQAVAQQPLFDIKQLSSSIQQFPNNFHLEMLTQYKENFQGISHLNNQVHNNKQIHLLQTNDIQGNIGLPLFNKEQQRVLPTRESEVEVNRKSWYKSGASVRQHLQTPYVRYGYSHLL